MNIKYLFFSFFILFMSFIVNHKLNSNTTNCLIVHGGGITGFWNTLGKLRKLNFKDYSEVHCYSSGCLAAIVKVNNYKNFSYIINKTIEIKQTIYNDYNNCYKIRKNFINFLLDDYHQVDKSIELSIVSSDLMTQCFVNKYNLNDKDKIQVKEKMLDSTYIPMITGHISEDRKFYDGSFCQLNLPKCKYNLHPNINLFNLWNIFNFNLHLEDINRLLLED